MACAVSVGLYGKNCIVIYLCYFLQDLEGVIILVQQI